jgi:EpsI family protein
LLSMVPLSIAAVLGAAWMRALALPLAFMFFAVPGGDWLVPHLAGWTADFVVSSLQVIGIPVYREADRLWIPSGQWTVKESCSGIRYLMACATLGTLYAAMTYRSTRRRAQFVAAMIGFAIVANWVRALGIVLLAHLTDNRLATGVDHLVYGWLFFGVILLVAFGLGRAWHEETSKVSTTTPMRAEAESCVSTRRAVVGAACAALAIALWPALLPLTTLSPRGPVPPLSIAPAAAWHSSDALPSSWRPEIHGAARRYGEIFEQTGQQVGLTVALYGEPTREAKLVTSSNRLIPVDSQQWTLTERNSIALPMPQGELKTDVVVVAGPSSRLAVCELFWVNGVVTGSRTRAALEEVKNRLLGRGSTSAWLVLYTPASEQAAATMASFARDMGPAIDNALRRAASMR